MQGRPHYRRTDEAAAPPLARAALIASSARYVFYHTEVWPCCRLAVCARIPYQRRVAGCWNVEFRRSRSSSSDPVLSTPLLMHSRTSCRSVGARGKSAGAAGSAAFLARAGRRRGAAGTVTRSSSFALSSAGGERGGARRRAGLRAGGAAEGARLAAAAVSACAGASFALGLGLGAAAGAAGAGSTAA